MKWAECVAQMVETRN